MHSRRALDATSCIVDGTEVELFTLLIIEYLSAELVNARKNYELIFSV